LSVFRNTYTNADNDGFYQITLPNGTYDITADAMGYMPETEYTFNLNANKKLNFSLDVGKCFLSKTAPHITQIAHTTGELELTVHWTNECDEEGFYVNRCKGEMEFTLGESEPEIIECNDYRAVSEKLPPGTTSFVDTVYLEPNSVYYYNITATYDFPFVEAVSSNESESVISGYTSCYDHYYENGNDNYYLEFCANNTRYECDPATNWPFYVQDCSEYDGFTCMGANANIPFAGRTICEYDAYCEEASLPFGLFSLYNPSGNAIMYNNTYGQITFRSPFVPNIQVSIMRTKMYKCF